MRNFRDQVDTVFQEEFLYTIYKLLVFLYVSTVGNNKALSVRIRSTTGQLPVFRPTNFNLTYTQGEMGTLYCSIENLGTRTVIWRKTSEPNPLTIGVMTYGPDDRFQVQSGLGKEDWNLLIKNIQPSDAGIYECQVSSKEKRIRRLVYVKVLEKQQKDEEIKIVGTSKVEKGDTIRIICNATGGTFTPEELDWLKDGNKLVADKSERIVVSKHISLLSMTISSVLTIKHASIDDAGTYVCRTSDILVTEMRVKIIEGKEKDKRTIPEVNSSQSGASSDLYSFEDTVLKIFFLLTAVFMVQVR
ncbi:hypothetical protein CHS0354_022276 [Potamilus streckersoni]|uniref:Ig-like domain-containing protein n=1 Tax=Potamilus streckersoni TaxID=2493646 RepID=A0AAE0TH17_9BIVA|nr:hypothetical protein CHS0354_022276 [Potamilus streckersoni]